jgi:hypothetical protein
MVQRLHSDKWVINLGSPPQQGHNLSGSQAFVNDAAPEIEIGLRMGL